MRILSRIIRGIHEIYVKMYKQQINQDLALLTALFFTSIDVAVLSEEASVDLADNSGSLSS